MNEKKLLLSYIRNGDFTHPGEVEVIDLIMSKTRSDKNDEVLDVGCGLGGTAHYIKGQGWKNISGIDVDQKVILHAKKNYPNINFYESNVLDVDTLFPAERFNWIYLLSSFYCFKDQKQSLKTLHAVAASGCQLMIFDYSKLKNYTDENPFDDDQEKPFLPIPVSSFENDLIETGWYLYESIDLTHKFKDWYLILIKKMETQKDELIERFGELAFSSNYTRFTKLLTYIDEDKIGGAFIYAEKRW